MQQRRVLACEKFEPDRWGGELCKHCRTAEKDHSNRVRADPDRVISSAFHPAVLEDIRTRRRVGSIAAAFETNEQADIRGEVARKPTTLRFGQQTQKTPVTNQSSQEKLIQKQSFQSSGGVSSTAPRTSPRGNMITQKPSLSVISPKTSPRASAPSPRSSPRGNTTTQTTSSEITTTAKTMTARVAAVSTTNNPNKSNLSKVQAHVLMLEREAEKSTAAPVIQHRKSSPRLSSRQSSRQSSPIALQAEKQPTAEHAEEPKIELELEPKPEPHSEPQTTPKELESEPEAEPQQSQPPTSQPPESCEEPSQPEPEPEPQQSQPTPTSQPPESCEEPKQPETEPEPQQSEPTPASQTEPGTTALELQQSQPEPQPAEGDTSPRLWKGATLRRDDAEPPKTPEDTPPQQRLETSKSRIGRRPEQEEVVCIMDTAHPVEHQVSLRHAPPRPTHDPDELDADDKRGREAMTTEKKKRTSKRQKDLKPKDSRKQRASPLPRQFSGASTQSPKMKREGEEGAEEKQELSPNPRSKSKSRRGGAHTKVANAGLSGSTTAPVEENLKDSDKSGSTASPTEINASNDANPESDLKKSVRGDKGLLPKVLKDSKSEVPSLRFAPEWETLPIFEPTKIAIKELRDHVINEIVSSEQSYVRELHVLNFVFKDEMTELAAHGKIEMTPEEVTQLFGFSQIILSFHIQLLEDLIKRLKSWDHENSTISDVLCKLGPFFRVMKDYSVTCRSAVKQITEIDPKTKPMLVAYLEEKMADRLCRGLDFGTYLTTAIKRIPRYLLLLRELRKLTTKPDHPEIECLNKADALFTEVGNDVNKAIVDKENSLKLIDISNILSWKTEFTLVTPGREFLKQFDCCECSAPNKRHIFEKKSKLWLFNNLVVLSSHKDKVKWHVEYDNLVLKDTPDSQKQANIVEFYAKESSSSTYIYTVLPKDKEDIMHMIHLSLEKLAATEAGKKEAFTKHISQAN